jgi:DNA-binding transcriptional LysR family regulator
LRYETLDDEVTFACSYGFAENWLMPRYAGLKRVLDGTRLRISTFDKPTLQQMEHTDIAVVWDIAPLSERPGFALFNEEAWPVCSPRYLQENPGIDSSIDALARTDLIHFDVGDSGFITWRLWFAAQGLDYRAPVHAHQYDALPFSMQAVLDGEGVGLGWRYLVDQMLDDGRLLRIGPGVTNREVAYFLQYREGRPNDDSIQKVVAWFKNSIASSPSITGAAERVDEGLRGAAVETRQAT